MPPKLMHCRTSTTVPVLSHLMGWRPVWFCTMTESPHLRGVGPWECSSQRVQFDMDRLDKARSCRLIKAVGPFCVRTVSVGDSGEEIAHGSSK